MKKLVEECKRSFILLSAGSLLLGILFLTMPRSSGLIICYICGGAALLAGVWNVVAYFRRAAEDSLFRRELVWGVIKIGAGTYIIARPQALLGVLPLVMGLVVLYDSLTKLQSALDLLRLGWQYWWSVLLAGGAAAVLGILMIADPFSTADLLIMFCGVTLVINALSDLWTLFHVSRQVKRRVKTVKREMGGIEVEDYVILSDEPIGPQDKD